MRRAAGLRVGRRGAPPPGKRLPARVRLGGRALDEARRPCRGSRPLRGDFAPAAGLPHPRSLLALRELGWGDKAPFPKYLHFHCEMLRACRCGKESL